jgi:hypothetical protein
METCDHPYVAAELLFESDLNGHPGGDSFVVYAASFERASNNSNAIRTYAYVIHCARPAGDRDFIGFPYPGEIGGPLPIGPAKQDGGGQPATRPGSE